MVEKDNEKTHLYHPFSFWEKTLPDREVYPSYPVLEGERETDILIIGAGMTGVICAHQLLKAGKKVIIVEAEKIGGGTTGSSTGNLYIPVQGYLHRIERIFGAEKVNTVVDSRKSAIRLIENIVRERKIDCDFQRRPWFLFARKGRDRGPVDREAEILKRNHLDVDLVLDFPLPVSIENAIRLEDQARFNPLKFILGLVQGLASENCRIFEGTAVTGFEEKGDHLLFSTNGGTISAKSAVMATHIPKGFHPLQLMVYPYRSYALAFHPKVEEGPHFPLFLGGHYWDTEDPHHSFSAHSVMGKDIDTVLIAGEHHKTGQAEKGPPHQALERLKKAAEKILPNAFAESEWSAQHYQSADGLPFVGSLKPLSRRIYGATGFAADGLTYGAMSGLLLAEIIAGILSPWKKVYQLGRWQGFFCPGKLIQENLNVAFQYIKDVLPAEPAGDGFHEVPVGEGRVLQKGGKKLAVYRDSPDQVLVLSAVCTHLKCVVRWNQVEKSWDCPCHGSRFDVQGKILEGPAMKPLPSG